MTRHEEDGPFRRARRGRRGRRDEGRKARGFGAGGLADWSRLWRDPEHGVVAGVLAGLADWLGAPRVLLRIVAVVALFMNPFLTLGAYFLAVWLLAPRPDDLYRDEREEAFWRGVRTEPADTAHGLAHTFRSLEFRLRRLEAHVTSPSFDLDRRFRDLH